MELSIVFEPARWNEMQSFIFIKKWPVTEDREPLSCRSNSRHYSTSKFVIHISFFQQIRVEVCFELNSILIFASLGLSLSLARSRRFMHSQIFHLSCVWWFWSWHQARWIRTYKKKHFIFILNAAAQRQPELRQIKLENWIENWDLRCGHFLLRVTASNKHLNFI